MDLPKNITDEIWDYCRLNNITDVNGFIIKMVKQGFTVEKYGATPTERVVEKEVEKIVEIEKIIEKPIEVIKEIEKVVEKEVYITDDEATKELTNKISELNTIIKNLKDDLDNSEVQYSKQLSREGDLNLKVATLETKVKDLQAELEAEKAKPKVEEKRNDIYNDDEDDKRGFFGSNLSNLWPNKNKPQ